MIIFDAIQPSPNYPFKPEDTSSNGFAPVRIAYGGDWYYGPRDNRLPDLSKMYEWIKNCPDYIALIVNDIEHWNFWPPGTPDSARGFSKYDETSKIAKTIINSLGKKFMYGTYHIGVYVNMYNDQLFDYVQAYTYKNSVDFNGAQNEDFLMPSFYYWMDYHTSDTFYKWAVNTKAVVNRYYPGKKIAPFIWWLYSENAGNGKAYTYIGDTMWRETLEICEAVLDGCVLWTHPSQDSFDETFSGWQIAKEFAARNMWVK